MAKRCLLKGIKKCYWKARVKRRRKRLWKCWRWSRKRGRLECLKYLIGIIWSFSRLQWLRVWMMAMYCSLIRLLIRSSQNLRLGSMLWMILSFKILNFSKIKSFLILRSYRLKEAKKRWYLERGQHSFNNGSKKVVKIVLEWRRKKGDKGKRLIMIKILTYIQAWISGKKLNLNWI